MQQEINPQKQPLSFSNGGTNGDLLSEMGAARCAPCLGASTTTAPEVSLLNKFKTRYARNNKSKTKKNMRCFPHCSHAGHKEKG
jgi:hypothetical protein